jgi:hypothetical protein
MYNINFVKFIWNKNQWQVFWNILQFKVITAVILSLVLTRCTHILGVRSSWWLNFVWWHLIFVGSQCETCFMSLFWHLQFLENLCTSGLVGRLPAPWGQKKWKQTVPPEGGSFSNRLQHSVTILKTVTYIMLISFYIHTHYSVQSPTYNNKCMQFI